MRENRSRALDLLVELGMELQRKGGRDPVLIIVNPETLTELGWDVMRDTGPHHKAWTLTFMGDPGSSLCVELPRGPLFVTTRERAITGRLLPMKRGKCEHGIPADYCTPCEVRR